MLFNTMSSEPARLFPLQMCFLPEGRSTAWDTRLSLGFNSLDQLRGCKVAVQGDLSGHKPGQASMIAKSNWAESGQAVSNPVWAPSLSSFRI